MDLQIPLIEPGGIVKFSSRSRKKGTGFRPLQRLGNTRESLRAGCLSPFSGRAVERIKIEEKGDWLPALAKVGKYQRIAAGRVPVPFFRASFDHDLL
jgi:hypothetical protein